MNRQWRVARYPRPDEVIGPEHFAWTTEPVAEPADGEFLVRTICLAPVPAQRGYLEKSHHSFLENLPLGEVMRGRGVGQIVASRHPEYRVGEIFVGSLGWQDYSIQRPRGAEFVFSTKKVAHPVSPLSSELGVLGQAGATAYFGLLDVGALKAGDNVLVSAAAGGVGLGGRPDRPDQGREARRRHRRLGRQVPVAARGTRLSRRHQLPHARMWPSASPSCSPTASTCSSTTWAATSSMQASPSLAMRARIVICGFISSDYSPGPHHGPINYQCMVYKRARMEGFVVFDYWNRYQEAERDLLAWYRQGLLKNCEDVDEGLEKMPMSLASLFTGGNTGVKICRVAPDPAACRPIRRARLGPAGE